MSTREAQAELPYFNGLKMKKCFIDVETTGLDFKENGILQLAGIIEIDGAFRERFNLTMQPFPEDVVEDAALRSNKLFHYAEFQNPMFAHSQFENILSRYINPKKRNKSAADKFWFIAYNSPFDNGHVRSWFNKCNDKWFGSYFHSPDVCIMRMAGAYFMNYHNYRPINFKQSTIALELGIDVDESKLHDALYDIDIGKRIYNELIRRIQHDC